MRFQINFDLFEPKLSAANAFHFWISVLFSALFGFWIAWGIGILWEIGDGFKKWYWQAPPHIKVASLSLAIEKKSWRIFGDWVKKEMLYSDKFSLQDLLIWDLLGSLVGMLFKLVLIG